MRDLLRLAFVSLIALPLLGACARQPRHPDASASDGLDDARPGAAALVFDPPASAGLPADALARDDRQPQAFVGYPEGQAEFFYLRWDDRQSNWGHGHGGGFDDRFERRAVSERVGVLYR